MKIWKEETNAKAACSGVRSSSSYYDDPEHAFAVRASTPSCSTSTKSISWSAATPPHGRARDAGRHAEKQTFVSLFALDVNAAFKYPKYFSVLPSGADAEGVVHGRVFQTAAAQSPKPETIALVAEDAEFSRTRLRGRA